MRGSSALKWCLLLCITLLAAQRQQLCAQGLTIQLPPANQPKSPSPADLPEAPDAQSIAAANHQNPAQPAPPDNQNPNQNPDQYPDATTAPASDPPLAKPISTAPSGVPVVIEADQQQKQGDLFTLTGNVAITYKDYVLRADRITYNSATGDAAADGHLLLVGGLDNERLNASHATLNLKDETGKLYDVAGTVGVGAMGHRAVYTSANPFTITGRLVVKLGPDHYEVHDGTMTSCRLPHPNWLFSAAKLAVDGGKASARNSLFRVRGAPVFYLPYVTHPVDAGSRQSGFLIPILGTTNYSGITGVVIGEQYYWVINRSMDMTVGLEYYSSRGWAQNGAFHFKGLGKNFATARYSALQDRGIPINGVLTKQGGEDFVFSGRRDYNEHTRAVADAEYLSAYIYRQAFTENFNLAVASNVQSTVYLTHENHGISEAAAFDRFQSYESTATGDEIRIQHLPNFDFNALEHQIGGTGLVWSYGASVSGLTRSEPHFNTNGVLLRIDLHPQLAYRLSSHGWFFSPGIGLRNTAYGHSQQTALDPVFGVPVERTARIDRRDIEAGFELRPPVLERTFAPPKLERLLHHDLRHTVEPTLTYRFVDGVNDFNNILRFDSTDIVSNTNEFEYGLTQRLFARPSKTQPCEESGNTAAAESPDKLADGSPDASSAEEAKSKLEPSQAASASAAPHSQCGGGTREWIEWRVAQKYFLDSDFGGAATTGRRQVLTSTLDFTGVSFLTYPRHLSPVISRLRMRTTQKTDVEWDLDYDTKAGRIASSNVFVDAHRGPYFAGLSHARLDAPGLFTINGQISQISNFNQMRLLLGYGTPTKGGLGLAGNAGYDIHLGSLQYGAIQASYNWDCCGASFEYRKFRLGPSVPSEDVYRFSFTLAGVGTAGNLRRAERLF